MYPRKLRLARTALQQLEACRTQREFADILGKEFVGGPSGQHFWPPFFRATGKHSFDFKQIRKALDQQVLNNVGRLRKSLSNCSPRGKKLAAQRNFCTQRAVRPVRRIHGPRIMKPPPIGYFDEIPRTFSSLVFGDTVESYGSFLDEVQAQLASKYFGNEEFDELVQRGTSRGRTLHWVCLEIPPFTIFPVHAHPGIECVFPIIGRLHEIRLDGPPPDKDALEGLTGGDLTSGGYSFSRRSFAPGSWMVNEIGSVHQSFTQEETVKMVAIWPGGYTFFPPEHLPAGVFLEGTHNPAEEEQGWAAPGFARVIEAEQRPTGCTHRL
jgi:hypothetical protein